ncbi:MAG: hypothetical protein OES79_11355, partial [Planctomycetota bacterium]|nr:hypothetical protein [Planctomycetota bacterium]
MTDDQPEQAGEPAEAPVVQPTEAGPANVTANDSPADVPAVDAAPPVAEKGEAADSSVSEKRTIKIGSQRDGDKTAQTLKAQPQNFGTTLDATATATQHTPASTATAPAPPEKPKSPPPRLEPKLSPEMQQELDAALGDIAMDELLAGAPPVEELEEGARVKAKVLSVREDIVLVDLDRQHQGAIAVKQFETPPEPGAVVDA